MIPQSTAGTDVEAHVGGSTASYVDLAAGISDRLMLVIAAVVGLGFVVLTTAFRSVVVSTQAAIANVLSVTAAFGVVTLCFQEGWGIGLVGLDTASGTDPIASFVPLIMFAVLFGLSMDYQVFLMSQIEQHRASADDDREAIAAGLAAGGKVIAAAALIMICVFASFILNGDPTVKQFGVGLSVGVALAAMSVLAARARASSCSPAAGAGGCRRGRTGSSPTSTSRGRTSQRPAIEPRQAGRGVGWRRKHRSHPLRSRRSRRFPRISRETPHSSRGTATHAVFSTPPGETRCPHRPTRGAARGLQLNDDRRGDQLGQRAGVEAGDGAAARDDLDPAVLAGHLHVELDRHRGVGVAEQPVEDRSRRATLRAARRSRGPPRRARWRSSSPVATSR